MKNNARSILDTLANENIKYFFIVPGKLINPFMSCYKIDDEHQGIKPIVCAHEEGAAFMADGYARASNNFGVCMTIGGPGTTNALTAIAAAYTDYSPVMLISGQIPTRWEMRGALQDSSQSLFNLIDMVKPVTVSNYEVKQSNILDRYMNRSIHNLIAYKQPCYLSIPEEVLLDKYYDGIKKVDTHSIKNIKYIDNQKVDYLINKISKYKKVAFLIGCHAKSYEVSKLLLEISEKYNIPVATTVTAKGTFPEDHKLSLGCFGYMGSQRSAEVLLKDIDCIIRVGFDFTQWNTMSWSKEFINKPAIDVFNDISLVNKYDIADDFIVSSYDAFLENFYNKDELFHSADERKHWIEDFSKNSKYYDVSNTLYNDSCLHPSFIIKKLNDLFPRDTILFVDSGTHRAFAGHYWQAYEPFNYFSTTSIGPMGWAIPASIGGKLARPNNQVLTITGDGCMLMHGSEIQTAVKYDIDITFVVINNSYYGQTYFNNINNIKELSHIPNTDFYLFAKSLGLTSYKVTKSSEVENTILESQKIKGPKLIEFIVDHKHVTPIYDYKKAIAES